MQLQFDDRQYKITLPKKVLEALGWKKGDKITIKADSFSELSISNLTLQKRSK